MNPLNELDHALCHLTQKSFPNLPNILLTGDFNLPSTPWTNDDSYIIQSNPSYGLDNKMLDIVNDHSLTQHVKKPTRGNNILDLVLTTKPDMISNVEVGCGISDHDIVMFDVNLKPTLNKKKPRRVFMFKKGNMEAAKNDLKKHFDEYLSLKLPSKL